VLLLNQTKATGPVIAAGLGPAKTPVDLIDASDKRQRISKVPVENRPNRGKKLLKLKEVREVWVL
jgi:hypothetical protein